MISGNSSIGHPATRLAAFLVCLLIGSIFGFAVHAQSRGGGMTSGGGNGESVTTEDNPWFVGTREVHYCLVRDSAAFSASTDTAATDLTEIFTDWTQTLSQVLTLYTDIDKAMHLPTGEEISLTTIFVRDSACSANTELTFYLGVIPDERVARARNERARDTVGFAEQTSFDPRTGRAKGFIWLTPDKGTSAYKGPAAARFWSVGATLYNVLMHEVGHIFIGRSHIQGTVMDEKLPEKVLEITSNPRREDESAPKVSAASLITLEPLWRPVSGPFCFQDVNGTTMQQWFHLGDFGNRMNKACFTNVRGFKSQHLAGPPPVNGQMKMVYSLDQYELPGTYVHRDLTINIEYGNPHFEHHDIEGYYYIANDGFGRSGWQRVYFTSLITSARYQGKGSIANSEFPVGLTFSRTNEGTVRAYLSLPLKFDEVEFSLPSSVEHYLWQ